MSRPYRQPVDELDVFRALAHPVRRKIIVAALDQTRSFEQLSQAAHRSGATLSAHLRILREAKIVTATRHGKTISYEVNPTALRSSAQWLARVTATKQPNRTGRRTQGRTSTEH